MRPEFHELTGPQGAYENFDRFTDRLAYGQFSEKCPTVLALQRLVRTKPDLAREIFEKCAVGTIESIVMHGGPSARKLSKEARRRIADLSSRFLQEPVRVLRYLEAIVVIEVAESCAEDNARTFFKTDLKTVRRENMPWGMSFTKNGRELAHMALGTYVQRRNYFIALCMVSLIDGLPFEGHLEQVLRDVQHKDVTRTIDHLLDGTADSLLGLGSAERIVDWAMGSVEF